jgi:AcrR family transcriptional regulator
MPRTSGRPDVVAVASAGRERANAKGDATRLAILLAAERLFAERGIAAVPLRDIGVAAGQKNNVAVQYHFGDRQNLVKEITAYRATASELIRMAMLADLFAEGRNPVVADLVGTFVRPLASHLVAGNHYLSFLSRYITERGGYAGLEDTVPTAAVTTLTALLPRLLPHLPEAILEERWTIMMTSAVHTLARYQVLMLAGALPAPIEELIADVERFLSAGIQAPTRPVADRSGRASRSARSISFAEGSV